MRYIYTGGEENPRDCKWGPRPIEGIVLNNAEWWGITDHLVKEQREREIFAALRAKEEAKKHASFEMTKNWNNTLASVKTLSEQKRIEKIEREKQDKIDKYNEIIKNKKEENKQFLEKVKKIMDEDKECSKIIRSGVLYSTVLLERQRQVEMKKTLLEEEKAKNIDLGKKFKAEAEEFEKEKREEKIRDKMKKRKQKEDLDKEMVEINLRKKEAEEEFIKEKEDLIFMKSELEKIKHCEMVEKQYRKEFAGKYIKKTQNQLEHEQRLILEQEEEDEIIKIYVNFAKRFQKERKEKEKHMLNDRIEERRLASHKLAEKLIKEKEEVISRETEATEEEKEKGKTLAASTKDSLEKKKMIEEAEMGRRYEAKEAIKWDMVQAYMSAEVNEKWRRDRADRMRKLKEETRAIYDEDRKQKQAKVAEEANEFAAIEKNLPECEEEELAYGQEALDFVKSHGMPAYPVLAAIEAIKKKNRPPNREKNENHLGKKAENLEDSERKKKREFLGNGFYCFKC